MSEMMSTSPEPAYLSRLGLSSLPFGAVTLPDIFYSGVHFGQSKDLLLHLLRSTQKPILLVGPPGSGKTTLLKQITSEQHTDLRICTISSQLQGENVFAHILQSLAMTGGMLSQADTERSGLEQLFQRLHHLNIKPVIFVDNVDSMPARVLERVIQLLQLNENGQVLVQAVFACSEKSELLSRLEPSPHIVNLPPLDTEEIEAYLMHRLHSAGYKAECPFSEKDMQRFYRKSGGNPAGLNGLAHHALLENGPKIRRIRVRLPFSIRHVVRISLASLAVILILVILVFQDQINSWMTLPEEKEQQVEHPDFVKDNEVATVTVMPEQSLTATDPSPTDELADLLSELNHSDPVESESIIEQSNTLREQAVAAQTTTPIIEEKLIESLDAEPNSVVEKVATQHEIKGRDWILSQRGTDYTFQLMGAWTQQEVNEYIEKYALTGEVAQFISERNGKPWHVLIYGVYGNKDVAIKASKGWPAPLNSIPTWLRRFDSVQKQIKEKALAP